MEKVKLTREQAKAIEIALKESRKYKRNPDTLLRHVSMNNVNFHNELHPLNTIDIAVLAKALYIGYEVEPEFKVGDWVTNTSNGYIKLIENEREAIFLNNDYIKYHELRHATPEEIAEEKERRWWAKYGREVWELKIGDVVKDVTDGYTATVESLYEMHVELSDGIQYTKDGIKKYCRIVCFSEDRKDI